MTHPGCAIAGRSRHRGATMVASGMSGGRRRVARHYTEQVRGTAENPVPLEEVGEKCYGLFAPLLGRERGREVIETIWDAERIKDVCTLRPLLRV
jgi:hypothetical protein